MWVGLGGPDLHAGTFGSRHSPNLKAAGETLQRKQSLGGGQGCRRDVAFAACDSPQKKLSKRGQRSKLIGLCQRSQQPLLCGAVQTGFREVDQRIGA